MQSISPEALELLEKYDWPGNVRELQSVIREALIVSAGPTILPDFLPGELHRARSAEPETETDVGSMPDVDWGTLREFVETATAQGETDIYRRALERFDRLIISHIMRNAGGQQNRAAEILGLSRVTLRAKLRHMQMSVEKVLGLGSPRASRSSGQRTPCTSPFGQASLNGLPLLSVTAGRAGWPSAMLGADDGTISRLRSGAPRSPWRVVRPCPGPCRRAAARPHSPAWRR